jgi:hypothetical protein
MEILIGLHNVIRWVVIVFAVLALVRAYRGWFTGQDYTEQDRKIGVFFGASMDAQMLLGIILWIFGSWGIKAFGTASGLEGADRMSVLFFAVEHAFSMVVAVVLVHVGTIAARRADNAKSKHKRSAILFSIAVLLILIAIPWTQRPLFPGL